MFTFGLACGVALSAIAAVLLGGGNINGAILARGGNPEAAQADAVQRVVPTQIAAPAAGAVKVATAADHVRGDLKKAKTVLIEYSDFQCPYCQKFHPSMKQVVADYGNDVAWVYRHFPLSFHPESTNAAEASECASEQGKFWEYGDQLFDRQQTLGEAAYGEIADFIGLDRNKFDACRASDKYLAKIKQDQSDGSAAGVTGTPATFVNGQLVSGAVPFEQLKAQIDAALKQ